MLEQQLVNALSLGCVYALFALGFTLIFGVLGVINLSHGAVFMVGAYAAEQAVTRLGFPLWGALLSAFVFCGALGLLIDFLVLRPLRVLVTLVQDLRVLALAMRRLPWSFLSLV